MARFVKTTTGWVNLDHVAEVVPDPKQGGEGLSILYAPDRTTRGRAWHIDVSGSNEQFVAAAPGAYAVVIDPRRGNEPASWQKVQIVAWCVGGEENAKPVLIENPLSTDVVAYPAPCGKWIVPYSCTYDTFEALIAWFDMETEA